MKKFFFRYCTLVTCDMALISGSLGALNIRFSSLGFGRARVGILKQYGIKTWTGRRTPQFAGVTLRVSRQLENVHIVTKCRCFLSIDLFAYIFQLILLFLQILYVQVYLYINTGISVVYSHQFLHSWCNPEFDIYYKSSTLLDHSPSIMCLQIIYT